MQIEKLGVEGIRCAEPSDTIVWDKRREQTEYTRMGRGA